MVPFGKFVKVKVDPDAPEVSVATVLPPEVRVTVAPATPLIEPFSEYSSGADEKLATALPPLTVTPWLVGLKEYPGSEGVTV
jgi:hypothetical protein